MRSGAHVVCAVAGSQVAAFELGVAHEVFGLDRSELVDPWYDFRLVAVGDAPDRRSPTAATRSPRRTASPTSPTPTRSSCPAWQLDRRGDRPRRCSTRCATPTAAAPASCRCAPARSCSPRPACSTAGRPRRTGCTPTSSPRGTPPIDVDPEVLYVDGGDGIYTSAGTAAGIDLCLHIVRLDHGAEVANAVARRMVVPAAPRRRPVAVRRRAGARRPRRRHAGPHARLGASSHLDEPLTVEDLARRALMSPRTFARRFRAATGTTPLQWLLRQRIVHAQRLLETTDLPVELIADRVRLRLGHRAAGALPPRHRHHARSPTAAPSAASTRMVS